ncbi:MAG: response regulator [Acetivibrionales bacterium]|jgi:two-component system chemotaxis response regulator CheY
MREITFVIADDATFMRTMLRKMIEGTEGYKVIAEAQNGIEAIKLAGELKPDIITLDITMPEMGGLEAVEKIVDVSPKTRIIMVSAMGQQSMVIEAIKHGASDFVVKPFEKSRFLQAVRNVLAV